MFAVGSMGKGLPQHVGNKRLLGAIGTKAINDTIHVSSRPIAEDTVSERQGVGLEIQWALPAGARTPSVSNSLCCDKAARPLVAFP